jgi:hypothetical protein
VLEKLCLLEQNISVLDKVDDGESVATVSCFHISNSSVRTVKLSGSC